MATASPVWLALLAAAAATAGCFSDRGLAIEVDVAGTGATSVELFLGKTACDPGDASQNLAGIDCKSIAPPPSGSAPLRGSIWFRDDLAVDAARVSGSRAAFQLRSDTTATVPIVIAVGLTADDRAVGVATLHDVTIPAGSGRVLSTALVPAGAVQPTAPAGTAAQDRVQVWRKTTPPSSCVVAEHWEDGTATRSFVVPSQDPDCDDVVDECNPAAYLGTGTPGAASRPDCFATQPTACVLGSRACMDGSAVRTGTCGPQHNATICVPDPFCTCTSIDDACWQDQIRTMPQAMPFIDCSVATTELAPLTVCPGPGQDTTTIELGDHFMASACGTATIASSTLLGFGSSATFGGAEMTLASPKKPCNVSMTWKSGARTSADAVDIGAIRIATSTGALILPLVLRFHPTVDACVGPQFSCMLMDSMPDDRVWSCAQ
ncbi:MAG TPA: hypothetical protein VHW23_11970 [Kofleriaceae bacterium]|jgi:hypothetical protein|nr:hypothetical protein [Kofleriaceae bacterium]